MKRAFTLVEFLIGLGVLVVVGLIALPNLFGGSRVADLTGATTQIVSSLRTAQSQAASQAKGGNWGIYFSNTTNTPPFYAVFNGTSYSSSTVTSRYVLPATVGFASSTVPLGSALSVTFAPVSGASAASAIVKIYVISQPSLSSTITVAQAGQIAYVTPKSPGSGTALSVSYIYIVDNNNNRVEKFDSSGNYVSQLGCASGVCAESSTNGSFHNPTGVAVDSNGNVYVSDSHNNRVEKFDSSGNYVSQIGCPSGACTASSTSGMFDSSFSNSYLAIDSSGNLYVADAINNNRVEKFDSSGNYVSQLGCASGACSDSNTSGQFNGYSMELAVDSSGNVYVSDGANRVQKFNSSGSYISQLGCASGACAATTTNGLFSSSGFLAVDSGGNIYVGDNADQYGGPNNNRVEKLNSAGSYISQLGCASGTCSVGSGAGQFSNPRALALDPSGNTYVADFNNHRVEKFDSSGNYLLQIGCTSGVCSTGSNNGQFGSVIGAVAVYTP